MAKPITSNFTSTAARFVKRLNKVSPDSPEFRAVLFRIGTLIRNEAVDNLTRSGAIDSGVLRSSISFDIQGNQNIQEVIVGAFGVRYARMVEFGGAFTDQMRKAMFASFNNRGKPPKTGKGIIQGGRYQARPYLGPAVRDSQEEVKGLLMRLPQE